MNSGPGDIEGNPISDERAHDNKGTLSVSKDLGSDVATQTTVARPAALSPEHPNAPRGKHKGRRTLRISVILTIVLIAGLIAFDVAELAGSQATDSDWTAALGVLVWATAVSWIAFGVLRFGWIRVGGLAAAAGLITAIFIGAKIWICVPLWLAIAAITAKLGFDQGRNRMRWAVASLLGPVALLTLLMESVREARAKRRQAAAAAALDPALVLSRQVRDWDLPAAPAKEKSTPLIEFRNFAVKPILDIVNYWRDRKVLLRKIEIVRLPEASPPGSVLPSRPVRSSPFAFAVAGGLTPGLLIAACYSIFASVHSLPKLQSEREAERLVQDQEKLANARKQVDALQFSEEQHWIRPLSNAQIQKEVERIIAKEKILNRRSKQYREAETRRLALELARTNRELQEGRREVLAMELRKKSEALAITRLNRLVDILKTWQPFIITAGLILTGYTFRFLARRMIDPPLFRESTIEVYLYTLGLVLVFPNIAAALAAIAADLSLRYDFDRYANVHNVVTFSILGWIAVAYLRNIKRIGRVLDDRVVSDRKYARRIAGRLLVSQVFAGLVVEGIVVAVARITWEMLGKNPAQ